MIQVRLRRLRKSPPCGAAAQMASRPQASPAKGGSPSKSDGRFAALREEAALSSSMPPAPSSPAETKIDAWLAPGGRLRIGSDGIPIKFNMHKIASAKKLVAAGGGGLLAATTLSAAPGASAGATSVGAAAAPRAGAAPAEKTAIPQQLTLFISLLGEHAVEEYGLRCVLGHAACVVRPWDIFCGVALCSLAAVNLQHPLTPLFPTGLPHRAVKFLLRLTRSAVLLRPARRPLPRRGSRSSAWTSPDCRCGFLIRATRLLSSPARRVRLALRRGTGPLGGGGRRVSCRACPPQKTGPARRRTSLLKTGA